MIKNIIFICILFISCQNKLRVDRIECNNVNVSDLLKLLNQPINKFKQKEQFLDCYRTEDNIMKIDYMPEEWKGISFYDKNNEVAFFLETSWASPDTIKRISIFNTNVKNTYIDQKFNSIVNIIDTSRLNEFPDGELGLINKNDDRINFMMDVSNNYAITEGVSSYKNIPDTLEISYLILLALD
jgi:hypothetical protein